MTKKDQLAKIHDLAKRQFDKSQCAVRDEREQCLSDRRFYSIAGAQWEGKLGEQFANKPKFEVNKIHLAVIRIINEYRNNRISVDFISKDGSQNNDLADTCQGLFRADEQDSGAEEAYDNAFEEAVGGGIGAWRLRACYEDEEDEENDHQRIKIEPIFDADSKVFFDLDAKRQDKADARYCFVLEAMTREAYEEEYGDNISSWGRDINNTEFDWCASDVVYVAEYYNIEKIKEEIQIWRLIDGEEERHLTKDLDDAPEILERLEATGAMHISNRKIERTKVHKYIMSGSMILEDCGYIAGRCIPIIPVYGKRQIIDNIERCMGHVRLCKDAQRLKNMQLSKLGEISALSAVEKPIMDPKQVEGFTHMWARDNIENYPYLLANALKDESGNILATGPMAYTKPPQVPPAMAALLQISENDMRDILGNQEQGEKIASNISAEAIDMVQTQLGMQTYIYVSNFAKAKRRSGEVWLSMAKDLYVEQGRKMKSIGNQEEIDSIELGRSIVNDKGYLSEENNLTKASFDVAVDVGPTSSSRRASTVRALTTMLNMVTDQQDQQVISSMIMLNMEGEGIGDVQQYYRQKLIRIGVLEPTDDEKQQMLEEQQNQQPDPQSEYLKAAAEEAEAKAMKAKADTILTTVKAEETRADTAATIAKMDRDDQMATLSAINQITSQSTQQINQQMASTQPTMSEEQENV